MQELKINKDTWQKVTLGDVIYEPKETAKNIIEEGFEHIVGLEHIDSEDIHLKKSFSIDTDTTFTKVFRSGDVLFGRRRAYLKKAAQASFDGVCSGDITVLRANERLDVRLLPFVIHNDKFFDYAVKHSAGGLSPRVKFKDLANYEFLLPPKEQQAELADLLWVMDEVIEKDLKVLERLVIAFNSFLNESFDKKDRYLLTEIGNISTGKTPSTTKEEYWNGDIPFVTPSDDFSQKYINSTERYITTNFKDEGSILKANSILFVCIASVGNMVINSVPVWFNQQINAISLFKSEKIDEVYYGLKIMNDEIKNIAGKSVVPIINKTDFSKITIPKLKIESSNFKTKIVFFESSIARFQSKLESSKSLQKSLINQLF